MGILHHKARFVTTLQKKATKKYVRGTNAINNYSAVMELCPNSQNFRKSPRIWNFKISLGNIIPNFWQINCLKLTYSQASLQLAEHSSFMSSELTRPKFKNVDLYIRVINARDNTQTNLLNI